MDATYVHELVDGTKIRRCMKCLLAVDENGNPDLDRYTARQYLALTSIPKEQRCDHKKQKPVTARAQFDRTLREINVHRPDYDLFMQLFDVLYPD